jgi:hypothetical protein
MFIVVHIWKESYFQKMAAVEPSAFVVKIVTGCILMYVPTYVKCDFWRCVFSNTGFRVKFGVYCI